MKKLALLLVLAFVAGFAVPASATHYNSFNREADCEGWHVWGDFYFASVEEVANMTYFVRLKQGYTVIAEFVGTHDVYKENKTFDFYEPWGVELCGDYTVEGSFHFESMYGSGTMNFSFMITCECNDYGCTYTPGFWKNHPEAWPVSELNIGGIDYSMAELLAIFDEPTVGDITIILFQHLIAAKLNVLSGADPVIQEYIDAADAYLVLYPLYSKPKEDAKTEGEDIKDALADYNELECPEDVELTRSIETFKLDTKTPSLMSSPAGAAPKTWGSIKKLNEE